MAARTRGRAYTCVCVSCVAIPPLRERVRISWAHRLRREGISPPPFKKSDLSYTGNNLATMVAKLLPV